MQGTNVNPDNSDLFRWIPSEANSKSELVNLLIRAYDKTREEGDPVDDVEWICYFTGWEANCGEIYLLSRSYANKIGYNGSFTFKNSDFMIVHGRNLDTTGFAPISKSKKLSKSHRFNVVNYQRMMPIDLDESEYNKVIGGEDSGVWFTDSINGKDFVGSAYYHPNENKLYHVYYDGNYDEDDVEQFGRLRHAFVYYDDEDDDYSASTKKSGMLSKSFNDMVKSIRRSASGQIVKSEGNLEQYLNEKVEIAHGSGRIRMEYITLKEAIDKYGIESLGNPDDPRVFARCPKLNGFLKPMRPNDGFIARYESQSAYDSLSF